MIVWKTREEPKPEPVVEPVAQPVAQPVVEASVVAGAQALPVGHVVGAAFAIGQRVLLPDRSTAKIASIAVYVSKMMYGVSGGSRLYEAEQLEAYVEPKFHVGQDVSFAGFRGVVTRVGELGSYTVSVGVHEDQMKAAE